MLNFIHFSNLFIVGILILTNEKIYQFHDSLESLLDFILSLVPLSCANFFLFD
jgi:thiamine transporter ThiT